MRFLSPVAAGLFLLFALPAAATDDNWSDQFQVPGANSDVYTAAKDADGNIYIGGGFTIVGNVVARGVARWNPSTARWSALESGVAEAGDLTAVVRSLAVDGSGNVYAAGDFDVAGNVPAKGIAKWDGASWSSLGTGIESGIDVVAVDQAGNVYAGGAFTIASGAPANRIAKWDGAAWSPLGAGMTLESEFGDHASVGAIAVDTSGNIFAAGQFTTAGGVPAKNIAKWDGTAWSALGTGIGYEVLCLAVDSVGNLYAGGIFQTAGGVPASGIAKWNGTAWSAMGTSEWSWVETIAVDESDSLYAAGGSFDYLAKWDGTAWSALGPSVSGSFTACTICAIVLDSGKVYAGGQFRTVGDVCALHVALWDGAAWSALGSGIANDGAVAARVAAVAGHSSGNIYAGGTFTNAGSVAANHIARWDGTAWSALGSGVAGGFWPPSVSALAVMDSGHVYAGGKFVTAGDVVANSIAKWDGSAWSAVGTGLRGGEYGPSVCAVTVDGSGNLYVGGEFTAAGDVAANNIARWDGTAWSSLGMGTNDVVRAIAIDSSGIVYAGGSFTVADGTAASRIAKWNGLNWCPLGAGIGGLSNAAVCCLAVDGEDNLYVGGYYATAGDIPAGGIARWDGAAWSPLEPLSGDHSCGTPVYALSADPCGNVYAGGFFTAAGNTVVNNIARWNGSTWFALGTGLDYAPSCITTCNGSVYAGGSFTMAGGKVSACFAAWQPCGEGEGECCQPDDKLPFGCFSTADRAASQTER